MKRRRAICQCPSHDSVNVTGETKGRWCKECPDWPPNVFIKVAHKLDNIGSFALMQVGVSIVYGNESVSLLGIESIGK